MTSRQRLLAAMGLQEVDRLPIRVRGVRVWDEEWVAARHASYRPVIEAVEEYCDLCASWSPGGGPLLTASDDVTYESTVTPGDDWNEHIVVMHTPRGRLTARRLSSNRGLPGLQTEFFVKNLDDLERVMSVPYEPPRPEVSGFFELAQKIDERGLVICLIPNPISFVHGLMGSELLAVWSRTERQAILDLVNIFSERIAQLVEYLLRRGIGPVFGSLGQEFAAPPLMSPADFHTFCTVPEAQIGRIIHEAGCLLHVHCHGPLGSILEEFVAIGTNCLHPLEAPPMGDIELGEAKQRVGGRICLEGNIQIGDIYAAPTDKIVVQTQAAIRAGGPTGFILCPTASPHTEVLPDQAVRNYVTMIETAVNFA